ncbi:MAG: hypothetical protein KDA42_14055 [Planctomycetales bacterium]|nr:hypothetical protein [Planctomycetales bacterium]
MTRYLGLPPSCSQLYLGLDEFQFASRSDHDFGIVPLESPSFLVPHELIRERLRRAHAYYLRTDIGCGCGWDSPASRARLFEYLRDKIATCETVVLLNVCLGNEHIRPSKIEYITLALKEFIASFETMLVRFAGYDAKLFTLHA